MPCSWVGLAVVYSHSYIDEVWLRAGDGVSRRLVRTLNFRVPVTAVWYVSAAQVVLALLAL